MSKCSSGHGECLCGACFAFSVPVSVDASSSVSNPINFFAGKLQMLAFNEK